MRIALIAAIIGVVALALVAGVIFSIPGNYVRFSPIALVCRADNELDSVSRGALEGNAEGFVDTLLGSTPESASDYAAAISRANFAPEALRRAGASLRNETATGPVASTRVFLVSGVGGTPEGSLTPCSMRQGAVDFVMRNNEGVDQGHVIMTQPVTGGARAFEVWMVKEDGAWKVMGFHFGPSQILTFSGADLWRQAQEQRARAHSFNAFVLYGVARDLLDRGPYLQLSDTAALQQDLASFQPPSELVHGFPTEWRLGDKVFSTNSAAYVGFTGSREVALNITWTPHSWSDDAGADRANHELIDAFVARYPEWRESFDAITARALSPDGHSGYGTVYLKDTGYAAPPSATPHTLTSLSP